jgi:DNA-nicking Smr family endonuclease
VKRPAGPDDARLWALVAATVRPLPGRAVPRPADPGGGAAAAPSRLRPRTPAADAVAMPALRPRTVAPAPGRPPPEGIEPNRRHRIARGREAIALRLDLHGFDQDRARARLIDSLVRAQADGARAVLVITGKGADGRGVLRRRVPEWLSEPSLRPVVAGFAVADRRHGGEGAIYVALKRRGG